MNVIDDIPPARDLPDAHRLARRQHLLAEVAGATRESTLPARRPLRLVVTGLAIAVLAVGAVVAPSMFDRGSSSAFAVQENPDGTLTVSWKEFSDAEAMQEALARHGVQMDITQRPVSPSLVGTVVSADAGPEGTAGVTWAEDDRYEFTVDPTVYSGKVAVVLGRATAAGESPYMAAPPFAAGEPFAALHCAAGWPMTADVFAEQVAAHTQYDVEWQVATVTGYEDGSPLIAYDRSATMPAGVLHNVEIDFERKVAVASVVPDEVLGGREGRVLRRHGLLARNIPCESADTARWDAA